MKEYIKPIIDLSNIEIDEIIMSSRTFGEMNNDASAEWSNFWNGGWKI